ncbi:ricin-type beta-trefoil lectin domain protein, partial [Actinacidiphila oryziradicis]|uniref:RICIN domain-containing protein n=1 Tax=Actinacidiphila oryziradicis TaxID=2571141 RepID=UPI0023F3C283
TSGGTRQTGRTQPNGPSPLAIRRPVSMPEVAGQPDAGLAPRVQAAVAVPPQETRPEQEGPESPAIPETSSRSGREEDRETPPQAPSAAHEEPAAASTSTMGLDEAGEAPPGSGTAESEGKQPPSGGRKKLVLAAAVIAGAILITVPFLLSAHSDGKPSRPVRAAAAAGTPLGTGSSGGPAGGHTSVSPSASPSPKHSGAAKKPASYKPAAALQPTPSHAETATAKAKTGAGTSGGSATPAAPAAHALVVAASGECLSRGAGTEGIQLFQDTCNGSADQQWKIASGETIRSSGKCMTVAGGATDDRTEIQLSGCDGSASQQFHLDGTELLADQSQKCVDIFGGASGTVAVLMGCNGRDNQTWTLR